LNGSIQQFQHAIGIGLDIALAPISLIISAGIPHTMKIFPSEN